MATIQKGAEHYDVEAGRAAPPRGRRGLGPFQECADKAGAELYCCCLPCFGVLQLTQPVWVLLELIFCATSHGACHGRRSRADVGSSR